METWEHLFQRKYEKIGINFQQKENVYTWHHQKTNTAMTINVEKKCGILFAEIKSTSDNMDFEEYLSKMFKKWKSITFKWLEKKAIVQSAKMICLLSDQTSHPIALYSIIEEFQQKNYKDVLLPKNIGEEWESTMLMNGLYKELEKGYTKKITQLGVRIKEIIEKKGHVTTKMLEEMNINEKGFAINFYHCGSIEEITIDYIDDQFIFTYGKKDPKIFSMEKAEKEIKELLEAIDKKMKVKNLVIKPIYHFERFMKESLYAPFTSRKDIYSCLLEKYSEEELEKELVIHYEKWIDKSSNRNYYQNISITNIVGAYVILDENDDFIYATINKEAAIQRLKKEAALRLEQEIRNEIAEIE